MKKFFANYSLYIAFAISLAASLISLALSEIFKLPPCVLCWYQRAMMYSIPFILGVGIYYKDKFVDRYVWPLAVIGWAVALYHTLLQWKILPESVAPCQAGISCTSVQINYFGFMTIPFGSLVAFSGIIVSLYLYRRFNGKRN
jgi:disulfide bond formation protein DsbB